MATFTGAPATHARTCVLMRVCILCVVAAGVGASAPAGCTYERYTNAKSVDKGNGYKIIKTISKSVSPHTHAPRTTTTYHYFALLHSYQISFIN